MHSDSTICCFTRHLNKQVHHRVGDDRTLCGRSCASLSQARGERSGEGAGGRLLGLLFLVHLSKPLLRRKAFSLHLALRGTCPFVRSQINNRSRSPCRIWCQSKLCSLMLHGLQVACYWGSLFHRTQASPKHNNSETCEFACEITSNLLHTGPQGIMNRRGL